MKTLTTFRLGQLVRVINPDPERSAIKDANGRVVRVTMRGRGAEAWVDIATDCPLPGHLRSFLPPDDRANHIRLYADECVEVSA